MSQTNSATLSAARKAYESSDWATAYDSFAKADSEQALAAEDLERQAWAARWSGRYDEELATLERAEKLYTQAGDRRGAARVAIHLGAQMYSRHSMAVAAGYLARASELLKNEDEGSEQALHAFFMSMAMLGMGDTDEARRQATEALEIAIRVGDRDLAALAKLSLGHAYLSSGEIKKGIALHDEASAAAAAGGLGPFASGFIYCSVIVACRNRADWRRASEWTEQATRWCDRQSVQYYPGLCRVHRAEVLRFRGAYDEAEQTAAHAKQLLAAATPRLAGWAHREMAEVALRRGDLARARENCQRALEFGTEPQPVLARLQLAEGDVEGALRSIESALQNKALLLAENHIDLLPAKVTIALAAGRIDQATAAAERLEQLAAELSTPAPLASAACARGELELTRGDPDSAADHLRTAWQLWCEIEAPYDAARTQSLLAKANAAQGDVGGALIQLQAARSSFERIGAALEAKRLAAECADLERRRRTTQPADDSARLRKTFMFTDIVDSTKLVELLGDESWDNLLQWHHRTLRGCFQELRGEEVSCEGDGFFVAFDDAGSAVSCAVEIQRRLAEHRVAHGFAPHVRIGVHTADALKRGDDYAGKGVHVAARIAAAAGANDVVVSAETLKDNDSGFAASEPRDLRLKGLEAPVAVVMVDWRA